MQVLCERQGRPEEARRYAALAHKCWRRAEPRDLAAELDALRRDYGTTAARTTGVNPTSQPQGGLP
jgi:hypothetical protein